MDILCHNDYKPHCRCFDLGVELPCPLIGPMTPPLSPAQLEWVRHCFKYNDATFFYLHKLTTTEIADLAQCDVKTTQRLRKL